jgi:hypothetical protein
VLWLFDTVEKFVISNVEGDGPWYSKSISVSLLLMKLKKSVTVPETDEPTPLGVSEVEAARATHT